MSELIPNCPKCGSSLPFKGHKCSPKPSYEDLERQLAEANKLLSRVHKGEYVSDIELYDEIERQLKEQG